MIKYVTVTNESGESLTMELTGPEKSGLVIQSISGLGPVNATINTTDIVTTDVAVFNSARLQTRNIVMNLIYLGTPKIEDTRLMVYKYFPTKKKVEIVIETDTRKAKIEGYVESNQVEIFSEQELSQVSIICPDPYFYDMINKVSISNVGGIKDIFKFPFSNESLEENLIEFGIYDEIPTFIFNNLGDAEVGYKITLHATGPVGDISLIDTSTGNKMIILSSVIASIFGEEQGIKSGDVITLNTTKGNKSMTLLRNGIYYNIIPCLGDYSVWLSAKKGSNGYAVTATYGIINLHTTWETVIAYEGI